MVYYPLRSNKIFHQDDFPTSRISHNIITFGQTALGERSSSDWRDEVRNGKT